VPFFDGQDVKLLRVLTDRGSKYCGNPERQEYELYLAVEHIDHSRFVISPLQEKPLVWYSSVTAVSGKQ
jgi:hypothetical protein